MDLSDLTYAMDKLNLYKAGQLGQLQSPQAMELYRQTYGAATSKPVQQAAKQVTQKGLGTLGRLGSSIITPAMGYGAAALMAAYGNVKKDAKIADTQERLLREAGLDQAAFDDIYPTLDTRTRGWLGNRFPEYYQDYMRRNY